MNKSIAAVLAIAALLALPLAAGAIHWPNFGGDAGHSGNQPVRAAEMGVEFLHQQTDAGAVRTALVTSGGDETSGQRVAYGKFVNVGNTANDQTLIHIRDLATGAEKVPADQQNIDDDSDGDGDAAGSDDRALGASNNFVTPVSSSSHGALGQLFVVHNDEDAAAQVSDGCPVTDSNASGNDISIAQFDETSGAQKADVAIGRPLGGSLGCGAANPQVSDGYSIESSPVLSPPFDNSGSRYLFFVAKRDAGGNGRLFRVTINNAGAANAAIVATTPQTRDVPGLNTKASPTIAYLRDPQSGFVVPYVIVAINAAAGAAELRAFRATNINEAQEIASPADIPGNPQMVSVPVTQSGEVAAPANEIEKAPALYAAFHDDKGTPAVGDDETRVHRFVQEGDNAVLTDTVAAPPALDGAPAPGLALATLATSDPDTGDAAEAIDCEEALQCVVAATGENLFVLDPATLAPVERLRDDGETLLTPGVSGFGRNAPLHSGGFVFIQDDGGIPYVLDIFDAERVPETDFTPSAAHLDSDGGLGQPAYSNGFLQYLTDRGLFVYQTGIFFPPNQPPVARFTVSPPSAAINQPVSFDATESVDPDGKPLRYEWDFDGDGTFEVDRGADPKITVSFPVARTYNVGLRVTDEPLERTSAMSDTTTVPVVIGQGPPNVAPTASFTATPNPAEVDKQVVFDASASRDPDGGAIARYEWDLDGNGSFETNSGTNPRTQRSYTRPAVYNVKLRVTDALGGATETVRQLTVTESTSGSARRLPRSLSSRVSPARDRTLPYSFRTSGTLRLPSGVSRTRGCNGRVTVTVKAGKKTISRRTTRLSSRCTYSSRVTFRDRKRIGNRTKLRFTARFQGNSALRARSARTRTARVG